MNRIEWNADTIETKTVIIDQVEAIALFMPTHEVIIPSIPAWVKF